MILEKLNYLDYFDNFVSGVVILDSKLDIQYFNTAFASITKFGAKRIEINTSLFLYLDIDEIGRQHFKNVLKTKIPSRFIELSIRIKDSRDATIFTNIIPINNDKETSGIILNIVDISVENKLHEDYKTAMEIKDLKAQVIQASKLASIGTLASGVAHELNNPLTSILGMNDLIKMKTSDPNIVNFARDINRSAIRMRDIIRHLQNFGRARPYQSYTPVDLPRPIENSFLLLKKKLSFQNIETKLDLHSNLPKIFGDADHIESIFQNLITNSMHAFEELAEKDQVNFISIRTAKEADRIVVIFEDNAGGVPENLQEEIFDPFFTTKDPGKGTGLGLSIVVRIANEHKAHFNFSSVEGKGIRFEFRFPLATREQLKIDERITLEEELQSFTKKKSSKPRLLIIDDEKIICEYLNTVLDSDFHITTFTSSEKAIDAIKNDELKYDLVLVDYKMPKHSGLDVVRVIKEINPKTPIVVMSGHAGTDIELQEIQTSGIKELIVKPLPSVSTFIDQLKKHL